MRISDWSSDVCSSDLSEPPVTEQTVAIGATSTQSSAFNAKTRLIRVHVDAIASILIGANPTAAATNKRMAANQTEVFRVTPGHKEIGRAACRERVCQSG